MNNSNSTDTSKTSGQPANFGEKSETQVDAQPAKVEEPKSDAKNETKEPSDDASGKSQR
ncbi:hypothetical protein [Noviluteimonas gilva]|uniref:Uncharacterized protein n=1 Tax=Noviluteimonas gilva TaxID=2682097 RepID=A0A7C9LQG5_9GAMM|nr:hypothetical protein [Lysobacter gilvus]MUV15443.1 hypothetical protein [Lysobacter gilvus]